MTVVTDVKVRVRKVASSKYYVVGSMTAPDGTVVRFGERSFDSYHAKKTFLIREIAVKYADELAAKMGGEVERG